jgi:hypothetical protein
MANAKPPYSLQDLQQEAKERLRSKDDYLVWVDDEGYNLTIPGNPMPEFLGCTPSGAMQRLRQLYPK